MDLKKLTPIAYGSQCNVVRDIVGLVSTDFVENAITGINVTQRWDSGDGLTSRSHGSRQQQEANDDSTTNMEPSYAVAWDTSRDLLWSTTTPCAPLKQSGVLARRDLSRPTQNFQNPSQTHEKWVSTPVQ